MGFIWRTHAALDVASWYGVAADGRWQPSLAGWWLGCVSLPLFQFLVLRWYFRLFIWARFLWQVSRIELKLVPTHPDRCGGLGFLAPVSQTFAPLLLAQGALLAGMMADRIFYAGAKLPEFTAGAHRAGGRDGRSPSWGRCWSSLRNSPRSSARACGSTALWRSGTCASSTRSGSAAARRRTSP